MLWVVGLLVPAAVALVVVWRVTGVTSERLAAAPAAAGIALGLASVVWAALFFGGIRSRALITLIDLAAWAAILAAGLVMTRRTRGLPSEGRGAGDRIATAAAVLLLVTVAAVAIASFASSSAVFPHGEWDAWAQ